jgi:hypothetical protein
MKKLLFIGVFSVFLTGCVLIDGSSLKSQLEIDYNTMFGTKFDQLDQVRVFEADSGNFVYQLNAKDFYHNYLNEAKPIEYRKDIHGKYDIKLSAVIDPEHSKGQQEAILKYDQDNKIICSEKKCIEVPEELFNLSQSW